MVKEDLDIANRRALEQIEKKKIEREEERVREQIEIATEKYEIAKELAEKKAWIDVCKRFEEEVAMNDRLCMGTKIQIAQRNTL